MYRDTWMLKVFSQSSPPRIAAIPNEFRAASGRCRDAVASNAKRWVGRASATAVIGLFAAISHFTSCAKAAEPIAFDIPSQSLNAALTRYGDITGREALYDASLTVGKWSGDVVGSFSPDDALRQLLSPTGLVAEFVDGRKFVLLPASETHRRASPTARTPQHARYYGLIQMAVLGSLCSSPTIRPGHYRIGVLLWIALDGAVARISRVGSTGIVEGDQQFDAALSSMRVGEPPPADFASPILMLIIPETFGMTACNSANATPAPLRIGR